jgi:hypothetical protein
MRQRAFGMAIEFGDLFRRKLVGEFFTEMLEDFALFFKRKPVHLLHNLRCTHAVNLLRWLIGASRVFPSSYESFFNFGKHFFRWNSRMRVFPKLGDASVKFGNLFRRQMGSYVSISSWNSFQRLSKTCRFSFAGSGRICSIISATVMAAIGSVRSRAQAGFFTRANLAIGNRHLKILP